MKKARIKRREKNGAKKNDLKPKGGSRRGRRRAIIGLYSRRPRIVRGEVFILAEVPEPFIPHRRIIHIIPPVVIIRSVGYLSQGCHEHRPFVHGDSIPRRRNRRTPVYETVRHRSTVSILKSRSGIFSLNRPII